MTEVIAIDAELAPVGADRDPAWTEIGRMRAAVKPVRASENEREGALREVQVYLFSVHTPALRAVPMTAAAHRLRWNGKVYNVREVRGPIARQPYTEIVAESGVTL